MLRTTLSRKVAERKLEVASVAVVSEAEVESPPFGVISSQIVRLRKRSSPIVYNLDKNVERQEAPASGFLPLQPRLL